MHGKADSNNSTRGASSGTGLIELLIVLGLAGIMAAGAVPGTHRIRQEWELWGSAHLVESSLLWARAHAITANDSVVFVIDQNGSRFYFTAPSGTRYEDSLRYLPAGIRIIQSPQKSLRFYPHGNAVPAGTFVIQGPTGTYRVIVNVMGRVRVARP